MVFFEPQFYDMKKDQLKIWLFTEADSIRTGLKFGSKDSVLQGDRLWRLYSGYLVGANRSQFKIPGRVTLW
jgi:hypothetical protein